MIRILLRSALPVLGIGLAGASVGPALIAGPTGEPLLVSAPDLATLQEASFRSEECALPLLLSEMDAAAGQPIDLSGRRIVAVLHRGTEGIAVAMGRIRQQSAEDGATLVLVFDETGRLIAAGDPLAVGLDPSAAGDCLRGGKTRGGGKV